MDTINFIIDKLNPTKIQCPVCFQYRDRKTEKLLCFNANRYCTHCRKQFMEYCNSSDGYMCPRLNQLHSKYSCKECKDKWIERRIKENKNHI